MALVFKIKHQETLRRWVVYESESVDTEMFSLTLGQLETKVRELFQLPVSASLMITYVDKEGDVITLGDDSDLIDACVVQRLNPLRLNVQVLPSKPEALGPESSSVPMENFDMETFIKSLFPQATTDAVQGFLGTYAPFLDPKLPLATLIAKAQDSFKEFLERVSSSDYQRPCPFRATHHHPYKCKHPHCGMRSKSMPHESGSDKDAAGHPVYHMGVQCDGCGMIPIKGTRYKSTKLADFDLCSSCFLEKGEEPDYEKLERPDFVHPLHGHDRHYRSSFRHGPRHFMGPAMRGRGAFARGPFGWRPDRGTGWQTLYNCEKLDARFVKDVTIFDGTELAPGTKFTKIWRMSNIGTLPWPQSTQLIHIGGDVLGSQEAVTLELPESGLACGEDVEVSVDLVAPDKAGRYISHWRLIAPSGQKFGQRVWVMIQVVPQGEQSPLLEESLKDGKASKGATGADIEENMPTMVVTSGTLIDVNSATGIVTLRHPSDPPITEPVEMMMTPGVDGEGSRGFKLQIVGEKVAGKVVDQVSDMSEEMEGFSLVEKPINEVIEKEMIAREEEMVDMVDVTNKAKSSLESNLDDLASMGFTNREVNIILLNKNKGNVQLTLDDLLVAAGWDGALRDLVEMGFTDQDTNIRLLLKYKGSIKAAVKDLVKMEKQKVDT